MSAEPPPPWHADAAWLREHHPEFVDLFMALSVARYLGGGKGGGQGVFYEVRSRLKHALSNDYVTVLTRMYREQYPHMPLYIFKASKVDGVGEERTERRAAPQDDLFAGAP